MMPNSLVISGSGYTAVKSMNGDREMFHVARSEIMRPSPSAAHRKSVKGYSPSKLPVCANSLFSSSISKGQSNNGRRRARSSISEALLLAANGERKRLVGGKTPTKGSAILAFASVVEADILDDQLDSSQLKPKNLEEELEKTKGCSFSDDGLCKHVTDMLQQPSCNEKVSKWLEESQHSTLTDLTDYQTVSSDEESEVNRREICVMATQVSEVCDYQDRNRLANISPVINPMAQAPIEVPIQKRFRGFSLARLLIGYLKLTICLSVVYMGIISPIWPTSWDQYVPPPT